MTPTSSLRSVLVDIGADFVEVTVSEEVFINLLRDIPVERARLLRTGSGRRPDPHSTCEFGGGTGWKQHSRPTRYFRTLINACHRRSESGAVFQRYKTDQWFSGKRVLRPSKQPAGGIVRVNDGGVRVGNHVRARCGLEEVPKHR